MRKCYIQHYSGSYVCEDIGITSRRENALYISEVWAIQLIAYWESLGADEGDYFIKYNWEDCD